MCSGNYRKEITQIRTTVPVLLTLLCGLSISMHVFEFLLLNVYFSLISWLSYVEMISFTFDISFFIWTSHWNLLRMFHQYSFEHLCGSLNILWHCLCFIFIWKLTFSSPVASAEFSKYAGILNAGIYSIILNKKGNSSYLFFIIL